MERINRQGFMAVELMAGSGRDNIKVHRKRPPDAGFLRIKWILCSQDSKGFKGMRGFCLYNSRTLPGKYPNAFVVLRALPMFRI